MEQGNFKNLGDSIFKIATAFLENEELTKLLYYTNRAPLKEKSLSDEEKYKLINNNILLTPELPQNDGRMRSFISIELDQFEPDDNAAFKTGVITIMVNCPLELWLLDDCSLRPFLIMSCVDGILNNKKIEGIGKVTFLSAEKYIANKQYAGYVLAYGRTEFN